MSPKEPPFTKSLSKLCWLYETLDYDVSECFYYVEPVKTNFGTYSIQFVLLLKDICGGIDSLLHYWYKYKGGKKGKPKFPDYYGHLTKRKFLGEDYHAEINMHKGLWLTKNPGLIITPLGEWIGGKSPSWWEEHQKIKHQFGVRNFSKGNLKNTLYSLGAFYLLLHDEWTRTTSPLRTEVWHPRCRW